MTRDLGPRDLTPRSQGAKGDLTPSSQGAKTDFTPGTPFFGATIEEGGVRFRVWAPDAKDVRLLLRRDDAIDTRRPARDRSGIWTLLAQDVRAGDRYTYTLDGSPPLPDPASRAQPDGVHGWSAVVDPCAFAWSDG
ncbi:MAG TPA: hypothetical protein VF159_06685, partial [Gemmatimonadaceae bacterium]